LPICWSPSGPSGTDGSADPHRLGVAEGARALLGQLAPVAGALRPAERQLRVGRRLAVDEDLPGVQLADEALPLGVVAGPGVRAEPEARRVGQPDRLLDPADPEERRDRPEDLLVVHAHLG